jgi:hypothetical protein
VLIRVGAWPALPGDTKAITALFRMRDFGRRLGRVWLSASLGMSSAVLAQPPANSAPPKVRVRILGTFDRDTGAPIEGAEVRDLRTGLSSLTTNSGTVALFLADSGGTMIQIRKLGYSPQLLPVEARDTAAITVVMVRGTQILPTVRVSARQRGDTIRTLERVGFYDRRTKLAVPSSAFVSAEKIEKLTTLSDLRFLTGRDVCTSNIFVDGVRIQAIKGAGLKSNVLDFLGVTSIAGIEMYNGPAEIPIEFGMTQAAGRLQYCATVVWTK